MAELKNEPRLGSIDTTVDLGVTGGLPRGYIPSTARRMEAYRRFSQADTLDQIDRVEHDLTTAYGSLPAAAVTLSRLAQLRVVATRNDIRSITRHEGDIIFSADRPAAARDRLADAKGTVRIVDGPDGKGPTLVYYRPPAGYLEGDSIVTVLLARLKPGAHETECATVVRAE